MGPRLFSRGKLVTGRDGVLPRDEGFNGAAAFQPRKEQYGRGDHDPAARASMGPRLFSRGKVRSAAGQGRITRASMGPRLFSRGKFQGRPESDVLRDVASMGPRLFSRGKRGARVAARPGEHASMGPRLFSRGKVFGE